MSSITKYAWSTIGRKLLMGITGLALCGFIVIHLLGNLTLIFGDEKTFNLYAHTLMKMGVMLYLAEIALIGIFLLHALSGVTVFLDSWRARPVNYLNQVSAGGKSHKTISSSTMIYTGLIIFLFLFIHVSGFKYGDTMMVPIPGGSGEEMKDLYSLVVSTFQSIWFVIGYMAVMIFVGFHLRHGFWSAFQSLGANHPRYMPLIEIMGVFFAIIVALGFLSLPIVLYIKY